MTRLQTDEEVYGGAGLSWTIPLVVLAGMALIVAALLTPARHRSEERHEYHGITWIGDECRVIEQGTVVICLVTETA